jgi:hypothetical protein
VRSNLGAEIVGYLHLYSGSASSDFVEEVTSGILNTFDELPDDFEFHAMMCFARLAEMTGDGKARRLLPKLKRGVHLVIGESPEQWESYSGKPLSFAPHPESLLAGELAESIQVQLDYEVDSQLSNGSWEPNWVWNQFESDWQIAKVEWAGWLTLRNLIAFKSWNRL